MLYARVTMVLNIYVLNIKSIIKYAEEDVWDVNFPPIGNTLYM